MQSTVKKTSVLYWKLHPLMARLPEKDSNHTSDVLGYLLACSDLSDESCEDAINKLHESGVTAGGPLKLVILVSALDHDDRTRLRNNNWKYSAMTEMEKICTN